MSKKPDWAEIYREHLMSGNKVRNENLERCPFCGGEAVLVEHPAHPWMKINHTTYSIWCKECLIEVWFTGLEKNDIATMEAWRNRK